MDSAAPGYSDTKTAHLKRLRRVESQVRGLQRMVEGDTYCIDALTQISAATKALESVALELLNEHLSHCVTEAIHTGGDAAEGKFQGSLGGDCPPRPILTSRTTTKAGNPMCATTRSSTTGSTVLPVIQQEPSCACCATSVPSGLSSTEVSQGADATLSIYPLTGMTCGHCASAVTSELRALPGVGDIQVHLVADGTSTVKITSETPLTREQVASALEKAGGYRLAAD